MKRILVVSLVLSFSIVLLMSQFEARAAEEPIRIGWSIWPGWMPWKIVEVKGFLKTRGANAELKFYEEYLPSSDALVAKKIDACSLTLNDTMVPMSKGTDLRVVLVNDLSDGGDGLLVDPKTYPDLKSLKFGEISLEIGSVSHFLVLKALESVKLTEDDITINNIPGDQAGALFLAGKAKAVATWNPHLYKAVEQGKGKVLYNSHEIYGLIPDLLVVRADLVEKRPDDILKIVLAWYDAMEYIANPKTHADAIRIMAEAAKTDSKDFEKLLTLPLMRTDLFTDIEKAIKIMGTDEKPGKLYQAGRELNAFLKKQDFIAKKVDIAKLMEPKFMLQARDSLKK